MTFVTNDAATSLPSDLTFKLRRFFVPWKEELGNRLCIPIEVNVAGTGDYMPITGGDPSPYVAKFYLPSILSLTMHNKLGARE